MTTRATLEEVLDFANAVRAAGGGNPLDALMPAVPEDSTQCLIAKNLNFNCSVNSAYIDGIGKGLHWYMLVENETTRNKIAKALDLRKITRYESAEYPDGREVALKHGVVLPEAIGRVAEDFDSMTNLPGDTPAEDIDFDPELAALVAESEREARGLATIVNADGSIVL